MREKLQQGILKNDAEIHLIFIKIPSKIDQHGTQERSQNDPGSKSVSVPQKRGYGGVEIAIFWRLWVILGAILDPFGIRWGPEWRPNSAKWRQNNTISRKI